METIEERGMPEQSHLGKAWSSWTFLRAVGWGSNTPLTAKESASTLFRFFRSKHVVDLRVIAFAALSVASLCALLFVAQIVCLVLNLSSPETVVSKVSQLYAGPILTLCCVVTAWAYRSASARLGVVDLFACEISTLCRVGTIFDIATHYVGLYSATPPRHGAAPPTSPRMHDSSTFVSQEQYFPVFDGNSRDLQLLEARVVNNIVEFYTFMKAMRDSLRRLSQVEAALAEGPDPAEAVAVEKRSSPRHVAIANVIYMMFLAYESARKGVEDLIEFEPFKAENTMVILLTELRGFGFLVNCFDRDDLRCTRLTLRREDYLLEVKHLCRVVLAHGEADRDWLAALRTVPELRVRFKEALGEDIETDTLSASAV